MFMQVDVGFRRFKCNIRGVGEGLIKSFFFQSEPLLSLQLKMHCDGCRQIYNVQSITTAQ